MPLPAYEATVCSLPMRITDALERGGRAVLGGPDAVGERYVQPTVLVDVPEESTAVQEETFGPTVTVTRVRDMDEAVAKANGTRYGEVTLRNASPALDQTFDPKWTLDLAATVAELRSRSQNGNIPQTSRNDGRKIATTARAAPGTPVGLVVIEAPR